MTKRNEYNQNLNTYKASYNYIALLRDKNVFEKYFKGIGIKTAHTIAIIKDGIIYDSNLKDEKKENEIFEKEKEFFIKSIGGECADGVYHIKDYNDFINKKQIFNKGIFIIQDRLIQHEQMNKLNPTSVNTIRIVTVHNGKEIKILNAVCRIGTNKNDNVDNWSVGGLAVEIKDNGYLGDYGYYKPGLGTKTDKHPDTNIVFKEFKIPYWEEIKDTAIMAHRTLYGIHSIGWDVAITDQGPVLIEGNDNWEISLMQINRGLKKEWENALYREGQNNG